MVNNNIKQKMNKKSILFLFATLLLIIIFLICYFVFDDRLGLINKHGFNGLIVSLNASTKSIALLKENEDTVTYDIYYSNIENAKRFKVGDIISIKYSGIVMESFPPQIQILNAKKIDSEIKETALTKIYLEAINNIITKSAASIKRPEYINIDVGSIANNLSLEEKSYILSSVASYNSKVQGFDKSIMFLLDDAKLTGTFVSFGDLVKISDTSYVLTVSKIVSETNYIKLKLQIVITGNTLETDTLEYLEVVS